MRNRQSTRLQRLSRILEELPTCIVVIDKHLRLKEMNPSASVVAVRGEHIRVADGKLSCPDSKDQRALVETAINLSGRNGNGARTCTVTLRGGDHVGAPLALTVSKLVLNNNAKRNRIELLLQFRPNHAPRTSALALLHSMGLSQAEVRLVQALTDGLTITEYAKRRKLSRETVRTQMKSALAKSGMHRQAELLRFVLGER